MTTISQQIELTVINCGHCGGTYALNERYRAHRAQVGGAWTCPYCQGGWGYVEGENARLKRELEETETRLRSAKCEVLAERNLKERAERKLRRVNRGVCPCCKRSFQNLARHMATKHPEAKEAK